MDKQDVLLLQYDLTNGMATKIYKFMTGKDLEAVWHTSLVVYGNEYFFGGGICVGEPRNTPYGKPIKESVFGKTSKTEEEFNKYPDSMRDVYSAENYHLLERNCNHFTDAICKFLCDKPLPDEILNQHKQLSDTAFGKYINQRLEIISKQNSKIVPETIEGKKKEENSK